MDQKSTSKTETKIISEEITDRLFEYMDKYKISKTEMATGIGISIQNFRNISSRKSGLTVVHLYRMIKSFPDLNLYWLIGGEGPENSTEIVDEHDKTIMKLTAQIEVLKEVIQAQGKEESN